MKNTKLLLLFTLSLLIFSLSSCKKDEEDETPQEDKITKISYKLDGNYVEFEYGIVDNVWGDGTIHTLYENNQDPVDLFDLYINKDITVGSYVNNTSSTDDDIVYFSCEGDGVYLKPQELSIQVISNSLSNKKIVGTISGIMYDYYDGSTHNITDGNFTLYYKD